MRGQPSLPSQQHHEPSGGLVASRAQVSEEVAKQIGPSVDIAMLFRSNPTDVDALLARVIQLMNALQKIAAKLI